MAASKKAGGARTTKRETRRWTGKLLAGRLIIFSFVEVVNHLSVSKSSVLVYNLSIQFIFDKMVCIYCT